MILVTIGSKEKKAINKYINKNQASDFKRRFIFKSEITLIDKLVLVNHSGYD